MEKAILTLCDDPYHIPEAQTTTMSEALKAGGECEGICNESVGHTSLVNRNWLSVSDSSSTNSGQGASAGDATTSCNASHVFRVMQFNVLADGEFIQIPHTHQHAHTHMHAHTRTPIIKLGRHNHI